MTTETANIQKNQKLRGLNIV